MGQPATLGITHGDPCRTPKKDRVTQPHRERVKSIKAFDAVERLLGSVDSRGQAK